MDLNTAFYVAGGVSALVVSSAVFAWALYGVCAEEDEYFQSLARQEKISDANREAFNNMRTAMYDRYSELAGDSFLQTGKVLGLPPEEYTHN